MKKVKFSVATADIVGTCPKCGELTTGRIENDSSPVRVECASCHYFVVYEVKEVRVTFFVSKTYGG